MHASQMSGSRPTAPCVYIYITPHLSPRIVKLEADHAQRESPERAEPRRTNGAAEPRPMDILELLSKAKEEYQRVRTQIKNEHVLYICR